MSTNTVEYQRKWRAEHPDLVAEQNRRNKERRREERRNKPAAPGVKGRGKQSTGFLDVAYTTENYHDELSWGIDKEKIRRSIEE